MSPLGAGSEVPDPAESSRLSRGELQSRAIRGAMWTVIHTAVALPLAFVVNIVIARVLGAVDYGRLTYLTTVMSLVGGVISLGVGMGVLQFGSKAHAAGRTAEVQHMLSASLGFRVLVVTPIMAGVVLSIADIELPLMVIAIMFGVVAPAVFGGAPICLGIENKTAAGAQNAMLVNVLTQVAVVVAVLTIGTADGIWATRLILGGVGAALALAYVSPLYRRSVLRPVLPRGFPPGFWKFTLPAGAAGLVGSLVVSRSEVLVLTWMSATQAAGIFALAFGVASHLFAPAQALLGPLVPAVSGLREVDEGAVAEALMRTLRASSTVVAILVSTGLPALAALVPVIYGEEFAEVPEVMIVLGIASGLLIVAGPVQAFVQARLSGMRLLWVNIVALVVDIALALALIPLLGVWGAVIANIAAAAVQLGILLTGEVRALGLTWAETGVSTLPTLLGAAGCLIGWFGTTTLGWDSLPRSIAAGAAGLAIATLGLRLARSGLTRGDTDAILRSAPRWMGGLARPVLLLYTHADRAS